MGTGYLSKLSYLIKIEKRNLVKIPCISKFYFCTPALYHNKIHQVSAKVC